MASTSMTAVGLALIVVYIFVGVVKCKSTGAERKYCHGDICNKWTEIQFCSNIYKRCRDCAEIVMDCNKDSLPPECIQFCVSTTCFMPRITNGEVTSSSSSTARIDFNSTVIFSCSDGFKLKGIDSKRCLGNDTWTEKDDPICLDISYIRWKVVGIILSVSFPALSIFSLILLTMFFLRRKANQQSPTKQSSKGDYNVNEGEEMILLIDEKQAEDRKINHEQQQQQPQLQKQPEEKQDNFADETIDTEETESSKPSTIPTPSQSTASIEHNHDSNQYMNGNQNMGKVNLMLIFNGGNNTNYTDNSENNVVSCQEKKSEENQTSDKRPTTESQETVVACQETQMTDKGTESESGEQLIMKDYARNEQNLVGYNDISFVSTGSPREHVSNCPIN